MTSTQTAPFKLPALPYAEDALQPHVSAETLKFHHGKHHKTYVDKLNELIQDTEFANKPLNEIVKASFGKKDTQAIFNNAAQHWNHSFFWTCMAPAKERGDGTVPAPLEKRIVKDFGTVDAFKKEFVAQGVGQFGSGWVWLVDEGNRLSIMKTHDADNPLAHGKKALLTCDVWEHAYYLDYQNRRAEFLQTFVDKLANWQFALSCLTEANEGNAAQGMKVTAGV